MRYQRFEQVVLVIGGAAFLGALGIAYVSGGTHVSEVVAQFLLLATLAAAVHFGARGGLAAAVISTGIYIAMWVPSLPEGAVPPSELLLLITRMLAFGLVGVVGGELFGRLKYSMTRIAGATAVDDWSRVYNQRYVFDALTQAKARFARYGEPFSVVEVSLSQSLLSGMRPGKQRTFVRAVADCIRADVRMVDDVGRLDDGRFVVLLPHTPPEGGAVVLHRLSGVVRRTIGASAEAVTLRCIGLPGDEPSLDGLIATIQPELEDQEASDA